MKRLTEIELLGDSILKGIQPDVDTGKYMVRNDIDISGLSREFGLSVHNDSHFGSTSVKGGRLLDRLLDRGAVWDAVVMDFGGNDCDFRWAEVSAAPEREHSPNVPPAEFLERYRAMVRKLKDKRILPILATLPPLEPRRFLDWWCRGLDEAAVERWMGGVSAVYTHQEHYSRLVEQLAREEQVPLVDLRGAFLEHGCPETLICEDGTHPNSAGQAVITRAFREFGLHWEAEGPVAIA